MVEYLPTYSPDLNPIEHKWAQAKSKKREMGCDTESLFSGPIPTRNATK
ncbi:transposase [Symbiopectobacterium purcellii]